jgi:thioredoxin-dependent peroxiredoxin
MIRSVLREAVILSVTLGCASSHLLAPGMPAPDFRSRDQNGREHTLVENRGHTVVLFFYPRDGTPGCTREACSLRDVWNRFEAVDARVFGVSTDDVASHASFAREHHLTFPLLADPDSVIVRAYGVGRTLGMASRITYLIDREGVIRQVFPDVDPGVHAMQLLEAIGQLPQ